MRDRLSGLAAGLGRGILAAGSLGVSELQQRQVSEVEKRKQQQLQQLGDILSGQSQPAFARPGGAEPSAPEDFRQTQ